MDMVGCGVVQYTAQSRRGMIVDAAAMLSAAVNVVSRTQASRTSGVAWRGHIQRYRARRKERSAWPMTGVAVREISCKRILTSSKGVLGQEMSSKRRVPLTLDDRHVLPSIHNQPLGHTPHSDNVAILKSHAFVYEGIEIDYRGGRYNESEDVRPGGFGHIFGTSRGVRMRAPIVMSNP